MTSHDESRKEKVDVSYIILGLSADVCQLGRSYIRGESKGVKKNIDQLITKLEKIHKRI